MIKSMISAVACIAIATLFATNASAQQHLFSQYSTSGANNVNASMYPAPHPAPGYVGSSMYTYQPLMPHEMMYTHARNYYNFSGGPEQYYRDPYGAPSSPGGSHLNVTKVRWQSGAMGLSQFPFGVGCLSQLKYKAAKHRYKVPRSHASGGSSFGGFGGGGLRAAGGCSTGDCSGGFESGEVIDGGFGFSEPAYSEPAYSEPAFSEPIPTGSCGAGCAAKLTDSPTVKR